MSTQPQPVPDGRSVDPVEVVREWYSQMNDGDVDGAIAKFHPRVEWVEADHSPYGWPGSLVGVEAIAGGVWSRLAHDWSDLHVVPQELFAAGRTVVVIGRYVGSRRGSGTQLDAQVVHVWDLDEAGFITRYRGFADTYALHQALATG